MLVCRKMGRYLKQSWYYCQNFYKIIALSANIQTYYKDIIHILVIMYEHVHVRDMYMSA